MEDFKIPKKTHLDEHIWIRGIEIGHTKEGLEFLIPHYKKMLEHNPVNMLTGPARKEKEQVFLQQLIERLEQHLELYNKYPNEISFRRP